GAADVDRREDARARVLRDVASFDAATHRGHPRDRRARVGDREPLRAERTEPVTRARIPAATANSRAAATLPAQAVAFGAATRSPITARDPVVIVRILAGVSMARRLLYASVIMKRNEELKTIDTNEIEQVSGGNHRRPWGWGPGWGWRDYPGYWRGGGGGWWNEWYQAMAMADIYRAYSQPNVVYVPGYY